jgi:rhodanese-related sulfurtransferase
MAQNDKLEDELKAILNETVPFISPEDLHRKKDKPGIVILDIRTADERSVSYIPGSYFISYDDFSNKDVSQYSPKDTVVLYCAVGYRSEKIGERLQELGFEHVYNLYGGIFEWKNKGFHVVNPKGEETDSVHTYNEAWSKYLKSGKKIYD